ncbi:MAG: hypothetical protein Q9225_006224 [Loekoesia sp. 1 TL-2023]
MHIRKNSKADCRSVAAAGSRDDTDSSEMTTPARPAEPIVSQETPVVNVNSVDLNEGQPEEIFTEHIPAQLTDLNFSRATSRGLETPSTAEDLYNATPRASPSPEPRRCARQLNVETTSLDSSDNHPEDNAVVRMRNLSLDSCPIPYDVGKEDLPSAPFFDKNFQRCLKSGKKIANDIYSNLTSHPLGSQSDSELRHIRATAERLRSFESPGTRTVGIVGDSAAGKSSLINSLLNIPGLAHKADHGSAVTSFVTEYHQRSLRHTAPFTIEAEYCNQKEINNQLSELLISFREFYKPGLDEELENDQQLYHEIERKSEVAIFTLKSIFPKVTKAYLRDDSPGAFERILDQLRDLAVKIPWPAGATDGKWTATAESSMECHGKVSYFMQKGLWPLTNIVRIYLSAQVLKTGVVLADLPGILVKGSFKKPFFVVARIDRVISDQTVAKFVGDQMKASGKRKNVTIVCTRADDIDLPSAVSKYEKVVSPKEVEEAKRAQYAAWYGGGSAVEAQLADTMYKYIYVNARNSDIKRTLKKRYANPDADMTVHVFCVGNRDYEGVEYRNQEARNKAVHGSCIPELRQFCHSLVARAQHKASIHFLDVELPSLIQSLEVWLSASQQEPLTTIDSQIVSKLKSGLERKVEDFAEALEAAVVMRVLDNMRLRDSDLNDHALEVSEEWTMWAYNSYQAFCRHNGEHYTQTIGSRSWNAELLGEMNESMTAHWPALQKMLAALCSRLQKSVKTDFKAIREKLEAGKIPHSFLAALRLRERELTHLLWETYTEILGEVQIIEFNARGSHISSFILDLMIPTYRACAAESGRGTKVRMHKIMKIRLDKRNIFGLIHNRIHDETRELFEEKVDVMFNQIVDVSESIERQLEAFTSPELEARKKDPQVVEKVRRLTDAAKARNLGLQRDLEPFKQSEGGNQD